MPLLGQPFDDWVTKQINVRQESLGKYTNISSKDLQYYITKTPWIRLASSVDTALNYTDGSKINGIPQKLEDMGIDPSSFISDRLASNFILQGGALSATIGGDGDIISKGLNSGLNNGNSTFNGAYGWGGTEERGYVPMPGITNADVQYLNNGALTKTTVNIRCFSKRQFQLIDILYLRPGYTLLLEFGHSVYLDNDGKLQSFDTFSTAPLRTLLNPRGKNQYDIYREIEQARFDYKGNYDAVYGKISNFNWQFNPDGSYDCQVVLTGMGDVIESLKMNNPLNVKDNDVIPTNPVDISSIGKIVPTENISNPIIANKNKTLLNQILYDLYQTSQNSFSLLTNPIFPIFVPNFPNISTKSKTFSIEEEFKLGTLEIKNSLLPIRIDNSSKEEDIQSPQTYITFGALMAIIQSRLLLYNNVGDKSIPIISFDMDFNNLEKDENYILTFPGSFSSNPNICLIPYSNTAQPIPNLNIPTSDINDTLNNYSSFQSTLYSGRLAGIFVNINYIVKLIEELPQNEDNSIPLLSFLKEIIKGITQSLGGFNQITVKSTIDGKIQFIEDIPQNLDIDTPKKEYARFKTFGVESGKGSFIKSINLTADLGSDFATMISIGAQNNGNQLSENAMSFSKYNLGLRDRIIPEKKSYSPETKGTNESEEEKINIETNFQKIINNEGNNLLLSIYDEKKFISENISTLQSLNTTHASLITGKLSQPIKDQQIQAPFFLPFNLSLEMEGLSGMVLYQKFLISDDVLPPSYEKDEVEIQIRGINHSIDTTAWTTKLDTLSVPAFKNENTVTYLPYPINGGGTSTNSSSTYKGTPGKTPPQELIEAMKNYGITNPLERAHFLSQVAHESGNYFYKEERGSGEEYEGREKLGNTEAGDGVRFKGRGYIQLTGRYNYQAYQNSLTKRGIKDDIMSNPSLVATKYAADSAAYWWKNIGRGGNGAMTSLALAGSTPNDVVNVTKGVNGGTNGIDDRQTKFNYYWGELLLNPNAFT
jgi:putative chitinase